MFTWMNVANTTKLVLEQYDAGEGCAAGAGRSRARRLQPDRPICATSLLRARRPGRVGAGQDNVQQQQVETTTTAQNREKHLRWTCNRRSSLLKLAALALASVVSLACRLWLRPNRSEVLGAVEGHRGRREVHGRVQGGLREGPSRNQASCRSIPHVYGPSTIAPSFCTPGQEAARRACWSRSTWAAEFCRSRHDREPLDERISGYES